MRKQTGDKMNTKITLFKMNTNIQFGRGLNSINELPY